MFKLKISGYFAIIITIAGCATVAITGRSQLMLVSDAELVQAANQNYSNLLDAANQKNAVLRSSESAAAASMIDMVNRASGRVIKAAGLQADKNWDVTVLKSNVPNAMVLPNGKIIVFTGLMPVVKTEAGLAAVIGHEVAHVAARHSAERVSQVVLTNTLIATASAVAAIKSERNQPAIAAALGLGLQYGLLMPFSRSHESEADRIGQIYMAKAGYDPSEAIGVWERMRSVSGKSKLEFLSTHPANETRQQQLQEWLPQAQVYFKNQNTKLPNSIGEIERVQQEANKKYSAPIALRPDIREDYWYKIRSDDSDGEQLITYDKLHECDYGKCIKVSNDKKGSKIVNLEYGIVQTSEADGSWIKFSKPLRPVKFPLVVGDSWEDVVDVELSSGKKLKGRLLTKVLAYEPIDVPAGKFQAYRTETKVGNVKRFEGWYVPEARSFAKSITFDNHGKARVSLLIDYKKSNDPSGEISRSANAIY